MRTSGVAVALAVILAGFSAFVSARGDDSAAQQKPSHAQASTSLADKLVREALAAESAGDNVGRDRLLADALSTDPNCRAAHWQSGLVRVDHEWISPRQAAEKSAADRALAEYRRHREEMKAELTARGTVRKNATGVDPSSPNRAAPMAISTTRSDMLTPSAVQANASLARWCRNKHLAGEERAHWTQVLLNDPGNREAQSRLGLHYFLGDLYTSQQIEQMRGQITKEQNQRSRWEGRVSHWRKTLDADASPGQYAGLPEMRDCRDAAVIPAVETAVWSDAPKSSAKPDEATPFQRDAIALLGRLPVQRATFALTRLAVLGKQKDMRFTAADQLRGRQLHDFVPVLLDGLENPIDLECEANFGGDGPDGIDVRAMQAGRNIDREVRIVEPSAAILDMLLDAGSEQKNPTYRRFTGVAAEVARRNEQINDLDRRINAVLERVTDEHPGHPRSLGGDPDVVTNGASSVDVASVADYWWNWWDSYNEISPNPYKPTETTTYVPYQSPEHHSCFRAGTLVTTFLGPTAIEKIRIGDCVLSQDVDTGELAYKPVLGTSASPPARLTILTASGESIGSTRGHAFWIDGKGWRMAKEAKAGDRLHGLHGAAIVSAVSSAAEEPVYNLNVADFHTYFVGTHEQILVHDYSTRMPSPAKVPGLVQQ